MLQCRQGQPAPPPKVTVPPKPEQLIGLGGAFPATAEVLMVAIRPVGRRVRERPSGFATHVLVLLLFDQYRFDHG